MSKPLTVLGYINHGNIENTGESHMKECILSFLHGILEPKDLSGPMNGAVFVQNQNDGSVDISHLGNLMVIKASSNELNHVKNVFLAEADPSEESTTDGQPSIILVIGDIPFSRKAFEFLFVDKRGATEQGHRDFMDEMAKLPSGGVIAKKSTKDGYIFGDIISMFKAAKAAATAT